MKFYHIIILIFLSIPIFAQYGNMKIIEPDKIISSQTPKKELVIREGFAGAFVEVFKDSKVKITVSVKCDEIGFNYPIMKLTCEDQSFRHIIRNHNYYDYSANFSLKKGIHFIKVEFVPIFKNPRSAIIERFFISGNNCKYIEKIDETTIIHSCHYNPKKEFIYGKITKNDDIALKKTYNVLINEETDLNSDYIEAFIDVEDIFSQNQLIKELVKNTPTNTLRVIFNNEKDLKLIDVFKILNYVNIYNKDIEIYNLRGQNIENLLNIIKLSKSLGIKSVIMSENSPVFPIK